MQTKRIICLKCRAVLDVKNSQNETVKQITCPSCKTLLQVKFQPQQEPLEAKTFYATPKQPAADSGKTQLGSAGGDTVLGGSASGSTELHTPSQNGSVTAKLSCGGKIYPLQDGRNIVGRQATTSEATVQIETVDRYMSRQHCIINVSTLPDGSKKAVLRNYQNKNSTTIDGQLIGKGDEIRLTDGNSITMGHTTVTFKLS
jgi:hypothetical protein